MSKADRLRQLQDENNKLRSELHFARKKLFEYQKRDKPILGDFVKQEKKNLNGGIDNG